MISFFCLIKTFSLFSGPIYQRRSPGGVSTCQPANSSGVYCKWSPYTSRNLEETRCCISRKQPEVKVCRCSETTVINIILVIAVQPSHPLWCAHAQVHICRWWVFTHPLCSGDWHRTLPLHGSKSSWNTTQESGPAGLWSVYENFTFKLLNGLQHITLVTKWPAYILLTFQFLRPSRKDEPTSPSQSTSRPPCPVRPLVYPNPLSAGRKMVEP